MEPVQKSSIAPKTADEVAAEWYSRRAKLTKEDIEVVEDIQKALVASRSLTVTFHRVSYASIMYLRKLGFVVLEESPDSIMGQTVKVSVKFTPPPTPMVHPHDCTCGECWKS